MAKKKAASSPLAGRKIRVKPGVQSPDFPEISFAGWRGTIDSVSGETCTIAWDEATVAQMPPAYVQQCEAMQLWHYMACLPTDTVELQ